jgi:tyrosyl-tRNA synthetase
MPTTEGNIADVKEGMRAAEIFVMTGLCKSRGEAVKMFRGGAGWVGERKISDHTEILSESDFLNGEVVLRIGKKRRHRLILR